MIERLEIFFDDDDDEEKEMEIVNGYIDKKWWRKCGCEWVWVYLY